jgi:succinate dehydrogenase/fumarate reductase flavoprotein subunit
MKDSADGKFDINTALDSRQSFDRDIDYNMSSAKGNEAVKKIRKALDAKMKSQVAGLTETDKLASQKIQELQDFKKQLITKD